MSKKSPKAKQAERIWKAIFADLYDRSQFDWWWDPIDEDTKREIDAKMVKIIGRRLSLPDESGSGR